MKITNEVIKRVVTEVAGNDVFPLVMFLKNKKNISEFKIAEALKQEVNPTRNMLYRLYEANLASYTRKKDRKKGWYIHYWTFNRKKIKYVLKDLKKKKLDRMQDRLEREKSNDFFLCKNMCVRLNFDQAIDFSYKCPECGVLMAQQDNTSTIEHLQKEIKKLQTEMKR